MQTSERPHLNQSGSLQKRFSLLVDREMNGRLVVKVSLFVGQLDWSGYITNITKDLTHLVIELDFLSTGQALVSPELLLHSSQIVAFVRVGQRVRVSQQLLVQVQNLNTFHGHS